LKQLSARTEIKRWTLVVVAGAIVGATALRTFWSIYLLVPLVLLGATAFSRAVVRLSRGFDQRLSVEVAEGARSLWRALAWLALVATVVYGHGIQTTQLKHRAEQFAMRLDERRTSDGKYPAEASDGPGECVYLRALPERFALVCTLTPPFEKATYTSHNKRWD
jgi:hypothetical protein